MSGDKSCDNLSWLVYLVFLNQDSKEQEGKEIQPLFSISFSLSSPSTEVTQTIISFIDIVVEYNHDLNEETHNSEEIIDAQHLLVEKILLVL